MRVLLVLALIASAVVAAPAGSPAVPQVAGAAPALPPNPLDPTASALPSNDAANQGAPDPLGLGAAPPGMAGDTSTPNTLPPFNMVNGDGTVSPSIGVTTQDTLKLGIDKRILETDDLLNRMVWQLNRETSWANSVHDIIQNYQYKYTKVLSNIKKHSDSISKMRELLSTLKKARLHEILERDLSHATKELQELAATSSETSEDEGSYASLKDRAALIAADLAKMSDKKVNQVLHGVQDKIKEAAAAAVPPPSDDTLKGLDIGASSS